MNPLEKQLKEVKLSRENKLQPSGLHCPNCSGNMYYGTIPCPDGKVGCLVINLCTQCGKYWR